MIKSKEIPIGDIGIVENCKVMAMEYSYTDSCEMCCFSLNAGYHFPCPVKKCSGKYRQDKKNVYFVKVENF